MNRANNQLPQTIEINPAFDDDQSADLRRYWYIFSKYKWGILIFVIAVSLLTGLWAYSLQPIYRSTATLLIGGNEPLMDSGKDRDATRKDRDKFFGTQNLLLKSRETAKTALAQLELDKKTWFDPFQKKNKFSFNWRDWIPTSWLEAMTKKIDRVEETESGDRVIGQSGFDWRDWIPASWLEVLEKEPVSNENPDSEGKLVRWLMRNLSVKAVRDTSMVQVSFETHDPKMSALVANAVSKAYIKKNLDDRIKFTEEASDWLSRQLEKSQQSIVESIDSLQKYREQAGLIDVDGMQNVYSEQLKILVDQLGDAQKVRAEAENLYRRAERLRTADQMDALPVVHNNSGIQRLKQQQQEIERQMRLDGERFKGNYPGREEAEHNLATLKLQIASALDQIVEGLKTDYEVALATERQLQARLAGLEKKVHELNRKEFRADALEQVVSTNRKSYDAYIDQLMKTSTKKSDTVSVIARIVDPAIPQYTPVRPKKMRMILFAGFLAGFAGMGFAFIREGSIFHNKLRTREDVENRLDLPLLGELMLLGKKHEDGSALVPATEFLHEPRSAFAESIRTIRAGVCLSDIENSSQVILVTSSLNEEGKSMVACNLALALGQLGNVLLIDADLRRPSLAGLCDIENKSPGLVDLVEGKGKVAECITRIAGDIHLLPAGSTLPPDPMRIFSSARFADMLSKMSQAYDSIVIDTSPVDMVSDARMLANQASGLLYVIKADSTPYQVVRHGLKNVNNTGVRVIGAVLNQVNPKKVRSYGKYKYGYYRSFDHYGQST